MIKIVMEKKKITIYFDINVQQDKRYKQISQ